MDKDNQLWSPLTVSDIGSIFSKAGFSWWLAGGLAIELAVGRHLRDHDDTDILILRSAEKEARAHLQDWDCWAVTSPGILRPWREIEVLGQGMHDIWCRRHATDDWRFQIMVDEHDGDMWCSRRNHQIRLPLSDFTKTGVHGIPYVTPEVLLFYKAKSPRLKDEIDFSASIGLLNSAERQWLSIAIRSSYGPNHPWLLRI